MSRSRDEIRAHLNSVVGQSISAADGALCGQCFAADTLVLMEDGTLKPISEVRVGESVWNHDATRLNTVTETFSREAGLWQVRAYNSDPITTTADHPFFALHNPFGYGIKQMMREGIHTDWLAAQHGEYTPASDLSERDLLISPTFEGATSSLEPDELRFLGYYLGDGCHNSEGKIRACATNQVSAKVDYVRSLGVAHELDSRWESNAEMRMFSLHRDEHLVLHEFISRYCNHPAHEKQIPDAFTPAEAGFVMEGYLKADGTEFKRGQWTAQTVSRRLAYGIQRLAHKAGYSCGVGFVKKAPTGVIEGRTVRQRNAYQLRLSTVDGAMNRLVDLNGKTWQQVRSVTDTGTVGEVFNLETDGDHSYVADNIGVHNCVSLIKDLMWFVGVPDPRAGRGNAAQAGDAYISQGIGKAGRGWLTVCVNRTMAYPYGHIWIDIENEFNIEQNGAIPLHVTKNTRPISQANQLVDFDQWVSGATATAPPPPPQVVTVGGSQGVLVQHPKDAKRMDLFYPGAGGEVWHHWTTDGSGMHALIAGTANKENLGGVIAAGTLSVTWNLEGTYLNLEGVSPTVRGGGPGCGQLYGRLIAIGGGPSQWQALKGQFGMLPGQGPGYG